MQPARYHHGKKTMFRLGILASVLLLTLILGACANMPQIQGTSTASAINLDQEACNAPVTTTIDALQETLLELSDPARLAEGTPADTATTEQIIAATWNMVNCWNGEEYASLVALWTPSLLQNQFGITDTLAAPAMLAGLPPLAIDSLGDVLTHTDGVVSVDAVYRREVGQHMLVHERWIFLQQGDWYLLHGLQPLPVEVDGPSVEIHASVTEHAIELDQNSFETGNTLIFHLTNQGSQPHEFAVFRPPSTTSAAEIISAGELPPGSDIIGATFAWPGAPATELVLVDLEPGNYIVICNMPMPDGSSHLAQGEVTEFTVQAP